MTTRRQQAARDVEKFNRFSYLAFDTETTGINTSDDRIVTASLVEFIPGQRPVATNWLINPGITIPDEATAVHGITTEHATTRGRDPEQALFEISARIARWIGAGRPLVAYNAAFDLTILEAENIRHGLPTLADRLAPKSLAPVLDPMVIDRHVEKYRKKQCGCGCGATDKTLTGCCTHYKVPLVDAHTAEADAVAAVRLLKAIINRHSEQFAGFLLPGLHEAQRTWRREQQNSLRDYFEKNDIDHDGCDPGWPLMQIRTAAGVAS